MSSSPSPESPSSVPSEDTVKIINARWIPRGCTLYDDIGEIIRVGARLEAAAISEKPDGLDMPEVKKKRYRCLYGRILSTVDGLGDYIVQASPSAINTLVRKITKAAQNARSEDTANLRNEFGLFASSDPQRTTLETPLTHSKDERGINHPDLARFLCPAQDLAKYDLDPMEGRKMMRDGRIKLEAGRFPIGFYKDHKYDPYNPEAGLFQSEELLKAARYIFTGKATTQDNYTPQGARGTTKINGIKRVTGYMIIYIACQVRFTASSFSTWVTVESAPKTSVAKGSSKSRIKPFSYAELHALGVSMLEREDGDEDETAREIKAVWNFHIFGDEDEEEHPNDSPLLREEADGVEEVSDWEKMEALRLARAKARQAKASKLVPSVSSFRCRPM
ncbi:hypothetical protein OF83DRAFT_287046 [Amylostereum chailletii]|nr:hypothetical protein OF83DRAFT_287046 [Amylostereum chailletii]